jgi:hypothetical protein|tara:strand:- start:270 stop:410 length:141 start_codon:yes stop_codon:yes gene_type:complete
LQGIGKFPRLAVVVMAVKREKAVIREEANLGITATKNKKLLSVFSF